MMCNGPSQKQFRSQIRYLCLAVVAGTLLLSVSAPADAQSWKCPIPSENQKLLEGHAATDPALAALERGDCATASGCFVRRRTMATLSQKALSD